MLQLNIVTPNRNFYSGDVRMVIARGIEGDLAVLENRSPVTTPLKIGKVKIFEGDVEKVAALTDGYISVLDNKVTIITSAAEWPNEIDFERAEAAKKRAEDRLKNKAEGIEVLRAKMALQRAINRLDLRK